MGRADQFYRVVLWMSVSIYFVVTLRSVRLADPLYRGVVWISVFPCEFCVLSFRYFSTGLSLVERSPVDGCMLCVVCSQIEVCSTCLSLVQRSPMDVCLL